MRIGFVGSSYTARSTALADEEAINFYAETVESQGAVAPSRAYGGSNAQGVRGYFGTPGLKKQLHPVVVPIGHVQSPVRGLLVAKLSKYIGATNVYAVVGQVFGSLIPSLAGDPLPYQLNKFADIANDGNPVSMACNGIQIFIVSAGKAYCCDLGTAVTTDVTSLLAGGTPVQCEQADGYFIVTFADTNKFQVSAPLDGMTWPGIQVNAVSVFPENIVSIKVNHRELWVMGTQHIQPYQNTGSDNIYDVIPGTLIEKGCAATFAPCRVDNSVFWIDEDERGGRSAWRSQGYTPARISTHAVETDLASYPSASISGLVSYAYQEEGHLFWVLYIPGSSWSWVYDVVEGLWHKRASWDAVAGAWGPHHSWNHAYAFGIHLVGDWATGNLYDLNMAWLDDDGAPIRRMRRAPTVMDEMQWIMHADLTVDFETGLGPTPPLLDGDGNPRPPQATLRWSDDRGKTWSLEHVANCGLAGEFKTRVRWLRLGRSRYRIYEVSVTDATKWAIVDSYLNLRT
jgi:hypothetical protein